MTWLKIAHRGAAGSCPELTRPAFERAMEVGVDMIELDVQLTRDGRLVVLHDLELGRTVSASGAVRDWTLSELCALDAGSWFDPALGGARVMALEDVLEITAGRVELNVEIKSPEPDWEVTAAVLGDLLEKRGRLESTVVSSFAPGALRAVRARWPAARLGLLSHHADFDFTWSVAAELGAASVHPVWGSVDEAVIAAARQRWLAVIAWTVNDTDTMARLIELGVDGIISDFPELFAGVADGRQ